VTYSLLSLLQNNHSIAHECGHGAFSDYAVVNGTVGWILHSILLVPYFSWAFSHAKHHRRTNDLVDGETHTPPTYEDVGLYKLNDKPKTKNGKEITNSNNQQEFEYRLHPEDVVNAKVKESPLSNILFGHAITHEDCGDEGFAWVMMYTRLYMGWQLYLFGLSSVGHLGYDKKPIEKGTFPDHFRPNSRLFPPKMYWKV